MIEPHSGTISVARPLDWEKKSNYNLNISITDGVNVIYQKVNKYIHFFFKMLQFLLLYLFIIQKNT